jgi:hypothetical protein
MISTLTNTPVTPQHPLFKAKWMSLGNHQLARLANRLLSVGASCYYFNENDMKTRLYLFNYYALLNGGPFGARWELSVYSTDGKRVRKQQGELPRNQSAPITFELEPLTRDLGPFGLCMVHLCPNEGSQVMRNSFATQFFVEYYTPQSEALLHSLGYTVSKMHKVTDYITSSIRAENEALLLLSNSCYRTFHYPKALSRQGIRVELRNSKGEIRHQEIEPIQSLACRKVDLRKLWPDLDVFLAGQPALIRVCGPNILYSPLIIQRKQNGAIALDHFQGGDWDEYESGPVVC